MIKFYEQLENPQIFGGLSFEEINSGYCDRPSVHIVGIVVIGSVIVAICVQLI